MERFFASLLSALAESSPLLILGFAIAGLIREFVPQATMRKQLGGCGWMPLLKAVGIGAVLPICSCSTIPLGVGMVRSGAARGTTLAFMTSSPAISPIAIVLGYALLGPSLLAAYVFVVLIGSGLLGWIGNHFLPATMPSLAVDPPSSCCQSKEHVERIGIKRPLSRLLHRLRSAMQWALFDLGKEISFSLLIGLSIATLILTAVPTETIARWAGQSSLWAILAVILLAIPAYSCSVPSMFIASSLLAKGASPGVAIAFLVAGPATNLGEINAIRIGMGGRSAIYYCVAMVAIAFLGGILTDRWLWGQAGIEAVSGTNLPTLAHCVADNLADAATAIPAWRWPFVVLLTAMMASGLAANVLPKRK